MLRPFLNVFALAFLSALAFSSCKKASTDDGGTRSSGSIGPVEPISDAQYTRIIERLRLSLRLSNFTMPFPPMFTSSLMVSFDKGSEKQACVLDRSQDSGAILEMPIKCSFDHTVKQAVLSYRRAEAPPATVPPVPPMQVAIPIATAGNANGCLEKPINSFDPLPFLNEVDRAKLDPLPDLVKKLLNKGALAFFNRKTATLLIVNDLQGKKYLTSGYEICGDQKTIPNKNALNGIDPNSPAILWKNLENHNANIAAILKEAKTEFLKKYLLTRVKADTSLLDDPLTKSPVEVEGLFGTALRKSVIAGASLYPIIYPVKNDPNRNSELTCTGYAIEIKRLQPNELVGFRGISPQALSAFDPSGWAITVSMDPSDNRLKFAHADMALGYFSDQFGSDAVLAFSPAVFPGKENEIAPLVFDCLDASTTCGALRGIEVPDPTACPRLVVLPAGGALSR